MVWAAILAALLVLPLAMCLMSSCFSLKTPAEWMDDTFNLVSLISNQGIMVQNNWWWERVVMAVWGLVTVVLTQSYAGNLMALLAVRHIPQPIQSLEEIVNDHSVALLTTQARIFRVVADLQKENRLKFIKTTEFVRSINTLVRNGHHILISEEVVERALMARDFSQKGLLNRHNVAYGEDYPSEVLNKMRNAWRIAAEASRKAWGRYTHYYDRNVRPLELKEGSLVWRISEAAPVNQSRKLAPRWREPYRVIKKAGPRTSSAVLAFTVPVDHMLHGDALVNVLRVQLSELVGIQLLQGNRAVVKFHNQPAF
nr:uncharacterized protein LOC123771530 [Procambarus clarkii]